MRQGTLIKCSPVVCWFFLPLLLLRLNSRTSAALIRSEVLRMNGQNRLAKNKQAKMIPHKTSQIEEQLLTKPLDVSVAQTLYVLFSICAVFSTSVSVHDDISVQISGHWLGGQTNSRLSAMVSIFTHSFQFSSHQMSSREELPVSPPQESSDSCQNTPLFLSVFFPPLFSLFLSVFFTLAGWQGF